MLVPLQLLWACLQASAAGSYGSSGGPENQQGEQQGGPSPNRGVALPTAYLTNCVGILVVLAIWAWREWSRRPTAGSSVSWHNELYEQGERTPPRASNHQQRPSHSRPSREADVQHHKHHAAAEPLSTHPSQASLTQPRPVDGSSSDGPPHQQQEQQQEQQQAQQHAAVHPGDDAHCPGGSIAQQLGGLVTQFVSKHLLPGTPHASGAEGAQQAADANEGQELDGHGSAVLKRSGERISRTASGVVPELEGEQHEEQLAKRPKDLDEVMQGGVSAVTGEEPTSYGKLQAAALGPTGKPSFADVKGNEGRIQVLSIDDERVNQQVMQSLLWDKNYELVQKASGEDALEFLERAPALPDMVLLDVSLPGMSGFEVTRAMRELYSSCELPIIMVTCSSLEEDVIQGLELGANDYMTKPLRYAELMARIRTQLALKRSVKVALEATRNLGLLRSILPQNVIAQLKRGVTLIAQFHENVTILFSDIRGFTNLAAEWPTERIILMLNDMFTVFDQMCDTFGVYKVETIGDAYMIVSGHDGVQDHALRMAAMARGMIDAVSRMRAFDGRPLQIRIGLHTGPAHSGVVGVTRPRYCFFGDTVNTASRMESHGYPMCIHTSEATRMAAQAIAADTAYRPDEALLMPPYAAEDGLPPMQIPLGGLPSDWASCGEREVKGKGMMETWLLRYGAWEQALAGTLNEKEPEAASSLLQVLDQCAQVQAQPPPQLTTQQMEQLQQLQQQQTRACLLQHQLLEREGVHSGRSGSTEQLEPQPLAQASSLQQPQLTPLQVPDPDIPRAQDGLLAAAPAGLEQQHAQLQHAQQQHAQQHPPLHHVHFGQQSEGAEEQQEGGLGAEGYHGSVPELERPASTGLEGHDRISLPVSINRGAPFVCAPRDSTDTPSDSPRAVQRQESSLQAEASTRASRLAKSRSANASDYLQRSQAGLVDSSHVAKSPRQLTASLSPSGNMRLCLQNQVRSSSASSDIQTQDSPVTLSGWETPLLHIEARSHSQAQSMGKEPPPGHVHGPPEGGARLRSSVGSAFSQLANTPTPFAMWPDEARYHGPLGRGSSQPLPKVHRVHSAHDSSLSGLNASHFLIGSTSVDDPRHQQGGSLPFYSPRTRTMTTLHADAEAARPQRPRHVQLPPVRTLHDQTQITAHSQPHQHHPQHPQHQHQHRHQQQQQQQQQGGHIRVGSLPSLHELARAPSGSPSQIAPNQSQIAAADPADSAQGVHASAGEHASAGAEERASVGGAEHVSMGTSAMERASPSPSVDESTHRSGCSVNVSQSGASTAAAAAAAAAARGVAGVGRPSVGGGAERASGGSSLGFGERSSGGGKDGDESFLPGDLAELLTCAEGGGWPPGHQHATMHAAHAAGVFSVTKGTAASFLLPYSRSTSNIIDSRLGNNSQMTLLSNQIQQEGDTNDQAFLTGSDASWTAFADTTATGPISHPPNPSFTHRAHASAAQVTHAGSQPIIWAPSNNPQPHARPRLSLSAGQREFVHARAVHHKEHTNREQHERSARTQHSSSGLGLCQLHAPPRGTHSFSGASPPAVSGGAAGPHVSVSATSNVLSPKRSGPQKAQMLSSGKLDHIGHASGHEGRGSTSSNLRMESQLWQITGALQEAYEEEDVAAGAQDIIVGGGAKSFSAAMRSPDTTLVQVPHLGRPGLVRPSSRTSTTAAASLGTVANSGPALAATSSLLQPSRSTTQESIFTQHHARQQQQQQQQGACGDEGAPSAQAQRVPWLLRAGQRASATGGSFASFSAPVSARSAAHRHTCIGSVHPAAPQPSTSSNAHTSSGAMSSARAAEAEREARRSSMQLAASGRGSAHSSGSGVGGLNTAPPQYGGHAHTGVRNGPPRRSFTGPFQTRPSPLSTSDQGNSLSGSTFGRSATVQHQLHGLQGPASSGSLGAQDPQERALAALRRASRSIERTSLMPPATHTSAQSLSIPLRSSTPPLPLSAHTSVGPATSHPDSPAFATAHQPHVSPAHSFSSHALYSSGADSPAASATPRRMASSTGEGSQSGEILSVGSPGLRSSQTPLGMEMRTSDHWVPRRQVSQAPLLTQVAEVEHSGELIPRSTLDSPSCAGDQAGSSFSLIGRRKGSQEMPGSSAEDTAPVTTVVPMGPHTSADRAPRSSRDLSSSQVAVRNSPVMLIGDLPSTAISQENAADVEARFSGAKAPPTPHLPTPGLATMSEQGSTHTFGPSASERNTASSRRTFHATSIGSGFDRSQPTDPSISALPSDPTPHSSSTQQQQQQQHSGSHRRSLREQWLSFVGRTSKELGSIKDKDKESRRQSSSSSPRTPGSPSLFASAATPCARSQQQACVSSSSVSVGFVPPEELKLGSAEAQAAVEQQQHQGAAAEKQAAGAVPAGGAKAAPGRSRSHALSGSQREELPGRSSTGGGGFLSTLMPAPKSGSSSNSGGPTSPPSQPGPQSPKGSHGSSGNNNNSNSNNSNNNNNGGSGNSGSGALSKMLKSVFMPGTEKKA